MVVLHVKYILPIWVRTRGTLIDIPLLASEPSDVGKEYIKQTIIDVYCLQNFTYPNEKDTIVVRPLPVPVRALCVRVYPLSWIQRPCLRLEFMGCLAV